MERYPAISFDKVYESYSQLLRKLDLTSDVNERIILFRKLVKLLSVMELLIVAQNVSSHL